MCTCVTHGNGGLCASVGKPQWGQLIEDTKRVSFTPVQIYKDNTALYKKWQVMKSDHMWFKQPEVPSYVRAAWPSPQLCLYATFPRDCSVPHLCHTFQAPLAAREIPSTSPLCHISLLAEANKCARLCKTCVWGHWRLMWVVHLH